MPLFAVSSDWLPSSGNWTTTNATVHVETPATITQDPDEDHDDRPTTADENVSGGGDGGAPPAVAAGGGSSTWWEPIVEFFATPAGAITLVALIFLFFYNRRS